jgi:hypothetical protein
MDSRVGDLRAAAFEGTFEMLLGKQIEAECRG